MRIVLLGPPGCGKGTQAELIAVNYQIAPISTGDLLRTEAAAGTVLGRQVQAVMASGQLVSDNVVLDMIKRRLTESDTDNGFLLDGFPRTLAQAESLDRLLDTVQQPLDAVVQLDVDAAEIIHRLLARGRADDNEATILQRLSVYEAQTKPLSTYYQRQGKLCTVRGVGAVDAIWGQVYAALCSVVPCTANNG